MDGCCNTLFFHLFVGRKIIKVQQKCLLKPLMHPQSEISDLSVFCGEGVAQKIQFQALKRLVTNKSL